MTKDEWKAIQTRDRIWSDSGYAIASWDGGKDRRLLLEELNKLLKADNAFDEMLELRNIIVQMEIQSLAKDIELERLRGYNNPQGIERIALLEDEIAKLTRELAEAQNGWETTSRMLKTQTLEFDTVGRLERNLDDSRAENAKLRELLKSSNIPALCQCRECLDLVEEFGKEKP